MIQPLDTVKASFYTDRMNVYLDLFWVFFRIGAVTFGGGYAMLPILERELVGKRGWTNREQLLDYYAIGQSTPGIIAVNVATFIGYNKKGVLGAVCATVGIVAPSIVVITLLATFLSNFAEIMWVQKALAGINVAVAALLCHAVFSFSKNAVKDLFGLLLLVASFIAMTFLKIPTLAIIGVSAVLGILIQTVKAKK